MFKLFKLCTIRVGLVIPCYEMLCPLLISTIEIAVNA